MHRWQRRVAWSTATALIMLTASVVAAAGPGLAAGGLSATFAKTSDWGAGYTARYTVANASASTITSWRVEFDLPSTTTLSAFWEADVVRSGNHYTATSVSYNSTVAPGGSSGFGFNANGSGVPTNCLLNGASCAAGGGPTSAPPSSSRPPT